MDVQKKYVTKTIEETQITITMAPEEARLLLVILDYIVDHKPDELGDEFYQATEFQKKLKEEVN